MHPVTMELQIIREMFLSVMEMFIQFSKKQSDSVTNNKTY